MSTAISTATLVCWFDQVGIEDVAIVGGKNASLGEMYRELRPLGVRVPNGFATTAAAYRNFLSVAGLDEFIRNEISRRDPNDLADLQTCGRIIRHAILDSSFPTELTDAICEAYGHLSAEAGGPANVAVRSSATAEDLPTASFAGQQETFLNVTGERQLLDACHRCFASLYTDRAISYRTDQGFDDERIALSVGVQRMVRSDVGASGVMFTIDTETGFRDVVLINAAYGLGESVVQGAVTPDEFCVFKPTLAAGFRPIVRRAVGSKETKLIYDRAGGKAIKSVAVSQRDRRRLSITDEDVLTLARWACQVEEHYSEKAGERRPMDLEWAKDGLTGELFLLQARPETVQSQRCAVEMTTYRLTVPAEPVITGKAVGDRIAQGPVSRINDPKHLAAFPDGAVLVTDRTDPDWEPIMKRASAIVTNRGGRTCHAAIISRELGLPAIVGTGDATEQLHDTQEVTVCCAEGETGRVYPGLVPFTIDRTDLSELPRPRTKIMMNLAVPEEAFGLSRIPNDGVGLARMEFIINNAIEAHPMALLHPERVVDKGEAARLETLTQGYADGAEFFVERLSEGVGAIAAAFYPKDVVVRMSDFKTNEYANLVGGAAFEPIEENPMIGFRGASRYYDERYRDAFALECHAMRRVRDEMGLTNVKLMIPFCRTADEGRRVLEEMATHGLRRGENGLEVYVMCEVPSNVFNADEFADVFDGFSIGSNDLTQLTLGVDRDSEIVAHVFNERDPAVTNAIESVIATAQRKGRKIGICGQAPSDYPEFAEMLVECGITSMSLNADAVLKMTLHVNEVERRLDSP